MRANVPASYVTFAQSSTRAIIVHLYDFVAASGATDHFTDWDDDITYNGNVYKARSLKIEGMRRKVSVGLRVDEQEIQIWAAPTDTIFGAPFLEQAQLGILDGCLITRWRAVYQLVTGNAAYDVAYGNGPLAVFVMFKGYMSEITKGGQTHIEAKVKSPLVRLEVNMPQNYYQPQCLWVLYSPGCGLSKAAFGVNGTVQSSGTSLTQVAWAGGVPNPNGADGIPTFAYGRILFTSGQNNNVQALINGNDSNNIYLQNPLAYVPQAGDTFTAYPGCSKSFEACSLKFNNQANFRGFDLVPPVMTSI